MAARRHQRPRHRIKWKYPPKPTPRSAPDGIPSVSTRRWQSSKAKDTTWATPLTFSKAANFFLLSSQEGTHAGACWVRIGEGEWQDLSETYGILNLEALIQSDNLPQNDLELTAASIEDTYIVSGTPFTVKYSVHNA